MVRRKSRIVLPVNSRYYANFGYNCGDENEWLYGEGGGQLAPVAILCRCNTDGSGIRRLSSGTLTETVPSFERPGIGRRPAGAAASAFDGPGLVP